MAQQQVVFQIRIMAAQQDRDRDQILAVALDRLARDGRLLHQLLDRQPPLVDEHAPQAVLIRQAKRDALQQPAGVLVLRRALRKLREADAVALQLRGEVLDLQPPLLRVAIEMEARDGLLDPCRLQAVLQLALLVEAAGGHGLAVALLAPDIVDQPAADDRFGEAGERSSRRGEKCSIASLNAIIAMLNSSSRTGSIYRLQNRLVDLRMNGR